MESFFKRYDSDFFLSIFKSPEYGTIQKLPSMAVLSCYHILEQTLLWANVTSNEELLVQILF